MVNRAVDVGQTVAATLQAPTLFTIAQDLTKMQVETSVDEADIGRIHHDTPVRFTVDAFAGETFTGRISQIRKAPQVIQNVVTYTVVVAVDNPAGRLLPGMTANVRFVTAQKTDVLKVPNAALRFRPADTPAPDSGRAGRTPASSGRPGDGGQVWIMGRDGRPAAVTVTLGITDGAYTEIVRGELSEGQVLLVGLDTGATTAAPSTAVRPPRL